MDHTPAQQDAPQPSVISSDLRIRGNLTSGGEVRIEGDLEGDIQATNIVVGEEGSIVGNVIAASIDVYGFVQGGITSNIVNLKATAHVVGETTHEEIAIEKGACLDGNFKRMRPDSVL